MLNSPSHVITDYCVLLKQSECKITTNILISEDFFLKSGKKGTIFLHIRRILCIFALKLGSKAYIGMQKKGNQEMQIGNAIKYHLYKYL